MAHLPPIGSPPVGSFRFNDETNMMEYYNGNEWMNITSTSPEVQTGGTRAVRMGGNLAPNWINVIDYWNLATTGNAAYFGDITSGGGQSCMGGGCTHTRGVMGGSGSPSNNNTIEYLTIAQLGNTIDFGDLSANRGCGGCVSNAHGGL